MTTIAVMPPMTILPSSENPGVVSSRNVVVVESSDVLVGVGEAGSVRLTDVEGLKGVADANAFETSNSNALPVLIGRFATGAPRRPTVPATLSVRIINWQSKICAATDETAAIVVVAELMVHTAQAE